MLLLFLILLIGSLNSLQGKKQILDQIKHETVMALDQPWKLEIETLTNKLVRLEAKVNELQEVQKQTEFMTIRYASLTDTNNHAIVTIQNPSLRGFINIRGTNNGGSEIVDTDLAYELYDTSRKLTVKHLGSGKPNVIGYYDVESDILTLDITYTDWTRFTYTSYVGTMTVKVTDKVEPYGDLLTKTIQ